MNRPTVMLYMSRTAWEIAERTAMFDGYGWQLGEEDYGLLVMTLRKMLWRQGSHEGAEGRRVYILPKHGYRYGYWVLDEGHRMVEQQILARERARMVTDVAWMRAAGVARGRAIRTVLNDAEGYMLNFESLKKHIQRHGEWEEARVERLLDEARGG